MVGSCKHVYENQCSIKGEEFLDQVGGHQLIKRRFHGCDTHFKNDTM
jgi:hypothetical protein